MAKPYRIPARAVVCAALREGGVIATFPATNGVGRRHLLVLASGEQRHLHLGLVAGMIEDGLLHEENGQFTLTEAGRRYERTTKPSRRVPQAPPVSFYLGKPDVALERVRRLEEIALPYGGRSRFLQLLADGVLRVVEAAE